MFPSKVPVAMTVLSGATRVRYVVPPFWKRVTVPSACVSSRLVPKVA